MKSSPLFAVHKDHTEMNTNLLQTKKELSSIPYISAVCMQIVIFTLGRFVYLGLHVREKAKQLSILLQDDERLKNERARALKAKERFAQSTSAFGSDGTLDTPSSPAFPTVFAFRCF